MKSETKMKLMLGVLIVLLVAALSYIGVDKYNQSQTEKMVKIANEAYTSGITGAVVSVYQQTENCQIATLKLGNVTRDIVDVACLKKQTASESVV